jgi:hypothetical protein
MPTPEEIKAAAEAATQEASTQSATDKPAGTETKTVPAETAPSETGDTNVALHQERARRKTAERELASMKQRLAARQPATAPTDTGDDLLAGKDDADIVEVGEVRKLFAAQEARVKTMLLGSQEAQGKVDALTNDIAQYDIFMRDDKVGELARKTVEHELSTADPTADHSSIIASVVKDFEEALVGSSDTSTTTSRPSPTPSPTPGATEAANLRTNPFKEGEQVSVEDCSDVARAKIAGIRERVEDRMRSRRN